MANKNEWITKPLGECLNFIIDHRGKTPKKLGSDWVGQGVPTISAKNINGGKLVSGDAIRHVTDDVYRRWMNTGDVKRGDCFLVSEGATLGECMYWDEDYPIVLGQRLFCLRANPDVLYPRYLYFYMTSYSFQSEVIARSTGTSVAGLRQTEVMKLQVRLPSLEEQRSIGDTLYNLNKHIELNRRMNNTLESIARAIFKSWFADFDPVRAKMDGCKPVGVDVATAALFPGGFEETAMGYTPQGWQVRPLSEVVEVNPRRTLPKGAISPYLDMKNMPTRGHCPDEIIDRAFSSGTKFSNGDTLLARITPCLENGKIAFVDFFRDGEVGWGSTEYIVFHPKPPLPTEFGYYLARSDDLRSFAIQNMTGTSGRQRVPPDCFNQYMLAVPPETIAKRFGDLVRPLVRQISANARQSKTLAATRDALLPKLLSGDIRLSVTTE